MDDAELKALLTAGAPPARDAVFELAVMARIEQRQFRRAMLRTAALGAAGIALLIPLAPVLNSVAQQMAAPLSNNLIAVTLLLAAALAAMSWTAQRD